jgi:aminoglycoside phosphotransferase (APT) family kinase protein
MGDETAFGNTLQLSQLVRAVHPQARMLNVWQLHGGVSAHITALEVELPAGERRKWIVRLHGKTDIGHNPHIAVQEFQLLQALQSEAIAAPKPVYLDDAALFLHQPCLVVEFLAGETNFNPPNLDIYLEQFTAQLVRIHAVDHARLELDFLPRLVVELSADEAGRASNTPSLLHGDYWPGNVLWLNGQLTGVVDWEDACLGNPLAEIANTRLELLWAFSAPAMQAFTRRYQALTGISLAQLPVWDLWAARKAGSRLAGWGLDTSKEQTMRDQLTWFIEQAQQG